MMTQNSGNFQKKIPNSLYSGRPGKTSEKPAMNCSTATCMHYPVIRQNGHSKNII